MKDRIKSANKWQTHYQTEQSGKLAKTKDDAGAVKSVTFKGQSISMSKVSKKLSVEVDDIRKEFCYNMVKNIEDRFPKEAEQALTLSNLDHWPRGPVDLRSHWPRGQ